MTGRLLFAGDSHVQGLAAELQSLIPKVEVETLVLPGALVTTVAAALRRRDLLPYEFVVIHVGGCDMYNRRGCRTACPKQVEESLLSLYQELTARVCERTHILMSGLLPKAIPTEDEVAIAGRYGVTRHTTREFNKSARKTNRHLRAYFSTTHGLEDILPVEAMCLWGTKNRAVKHYFSGDCVHLSRAGRKTVAKAIQKGLMDLLVNQMDNL